MYLENKEEKWKWLNCVIFSVNLAASDGEDSDDESFQRDTDTSASDSYLSGKSGRQHPVYSSGDMEDLAAQDKPSLLKG